MKIPNSHITKEQKEAILHKLRKGKTRAYTEGIKTYLFEPTPHINPYSPDKGPEEYSKWLSWNAGRGAAHVEVVRTYGLE